MPTRLLELLTWLVIVALYLGVGTFDHDVWAPVEPTTAGVVWSMSTTGDLAVPRINAEIPFLDTPPLYAWLATLSGRVLGGLSPGALRLPAVLLGLVMLGVVFWIARRAHGPRVACVAVLVAAQCGMLWDLAHRAGTDVAGAALAFLAFGLFARSLDAETDHEEARWDVAFALVLAGSFYAKNLFSGFVVFPVVAAFLVGRARFARLGRLTWIGAVAVVLLALPWAWALHRAGGWEYVRVALVDNTVGRLLSLEDLRPAGLDPVNDAWVAEKAPWHFYLLPALYLPLPWTPLALLGLLRLHQRPERRTELQSFLLLGFVGVPLVLSLSSAKSADYLAPHLFFVFLLVADLLAEWLEAPERLPAWQRAAIVLNVAVVLVVTAAAPAALGIYLGRPLPAALGVVAIVGAGGLVRRLRSAPAGWAWLVRSTLLGAVASVAFLAYGVPALDREKSFRPFFDGIGPTLEGRVVATTFRDAYRLPLITYYLDRRLPVVEGWAVPILLEGTRPVGVLVDPALHESLRERLEGLGGAFAVEEGGGDRYVLLANAPESGRGALRSRRPGTGSRTRPATRR